MKMITPVKFSDVKIDDGFWTPRLQSHKDVTLNVCDGRVLYENGEYKTLDREKILYEVGAAEKRLYA